MDFTRLIIWIFFCFCLGLVALGILVFFRNKAAKRNRSFQLLQYGLIMMFAYGFYGLWSRIFFRQFFAGAAGGNVAVVFDFLELSGLPFLLIGLGFLVSWTAKLVPGLNSLKFIIPGFLILITFYSLIGFIIDDPDPGQLIAACLLLPVACLALILLVSGTEELPKKDSRIIGLLLASFALLQLPWIINQRLDILPDTGLTFLFFLNLTALGSYFTYRLKVIPDKPLPEVPPMEQFFSSYGITSRESEVILGIYQGKTNREIAENMFVTVQTIKDHTHRIYQKTSNH